MSEPTFQPEDTYAVFTKDDLWRFVAAVFIGSYALGCLMTLVAVLVLGGFS